MLPDRPTMQQGSTSSPIERQGAQGEGSLMYPVLIVGVGGAGGKTVRALRETLMRKPRGADKIHRGYASPPRHM